MYAVIMEALSSIANVQSSKVSSKFVVVDRRDKKPCCALLIFNFQLQLKVYFTHSCLNMCGPKHVLAVVRRWNFDKILGLITRKWYNIKQNSLRKGTTLACPLPDRMNPNVQKRIPFAVTLVTRRAPKSTKSCLGKSDPLTEKNENFAMK